MSVFNKSGGALRRRGRSTAAKTNPESVLQRRILNALNFLPNVTVCQISPYATKDTARRQFLNSIQRFERCAERGPAVWVERVNSGSIKSEHSNRRIRSVKPGTFDLGIVVAPWGVGGQLEIKTPDGGDLNPNQETNLLWLKATGQIHGELRHVDDGKAAIAEAIGICRARFGDLS